MAVPVYATDLTTILLEFPNTTGWTAVGGGASGLAAPETDYFVQGANCISKAAWASALKGMIYDFGSGITVPTTGAVVIWINHATMNSVAAQSSGGLRMIIGSSATAYKHWYVGGNDTEILGLHNPYPVDPTLTADATTGAPSATLQFFGGLANLPSGGPTKGAPFALDAMRYGRCRMDVTEGSIADGDATFAGLESTGNSVSNRWGLIEKIKGVFLMQGFLQLGTSTTAVRFVDANRVIFWRDALKVATAFHRVEIQNASSVVTWTNITMQALGTTSRGTFVVTAGTATLTGCVFVDMGTFTFLAGTTASSTFRRCLAVTAPGSDLRDSRFETSDVAADASALVWNVATDVDGKLDRCFWSKGATAHHAIELGASAPLSTTFRNCTFSGFNAADGNNDSTFFTADRGSNQTWTINLVSCTGNFTVKKGRAGDTVNFVINPVTTLVNVKDNNNNNLDGALVYLRALDGTGPMPFQDSVTITRAGAVATVTHAAHGMETGDLVVIKGITDKTEDNAGTHAITVLTAGTYTYVTTDSGSTSYTGSIISTWIAIATTTAGGGNASKVKSYTANQPVTGWVRKSTTAPRFKPADISGTINSSSGLTISAKMVLDE